MTPNIEPEAICQDCGCPWDKDGQCGCEPSETPMKCTDCGGSGSTIEGWTCEFCEGTGELDF